MLLAVALPVLPLVGSGVLERVVLGGPGHPTKSTFRNPFGTWRE
jgi:hypothetical protein